MSEDDHEEGEVFPSRVAEAKDSQASVTAPTLQRVRQRRRRQQPVPHTENTFRNHDVFANSTQWGLATY
ncbi:hypothetical protein Plhal304r1_c016g0060461 [Plasmopara halstedii]